MAECVVCEKIKEKKALIIYEDDLVCVVMPSKPVCIGHMKAYPRNHASKLDELDDNLIDRLFFISNIVSSAAFDTMRAHGSNIILNETQDHLAIDIVPRKENDGLNFLWKPTQPEPDELDEVFSGIKDKAFGIGKKEEKKVVVVEDKLPVEKISMTIPQATQPKKEDFAKDNKNKDDGKKEPEKVNYLVKNIIKIP